MGDQRFPKTHRLRKRGEYLRVQERGLKVSADPLLALVLPNAQAQTRIGITVSSKVGNAVVRNRIRRSVRELFRKKRGELPPGLDIVFIARRSAAEASRATLARAFDRISSRLKGTAR